ncbi:MAG: hypothetical protein GY765_07225, partial [bacterium]|nr:hypothetical protein [bacterium]
IYFAADTTNVYISEWYNDKRDFFDADVVALAMGQGITLEDAVLDKGVVLRGRITDGNAGIANAAVNLYDLSYTHIAMGTSDYNGNFTLSGLPSATYKAYVEADGFIKQWYNDTYSFENADVIVLDISDKTLEDIVLVRGGTLGGRVTDDQGVGVPDIAVNVYDRDYNYLSSVITDAAGSYSLSGLPGVDCKIFFSTDGNRAFLGEWYNDKADFDSADFISIALGGTTVLSDAVLVRGGIINGRVVNEQGRGIPDISVTAFDSAYYYRGYAYTDANGYYTMPGLKGGMVKVYFDAYAAGNYQSEWYDNKASFETADFVSVNAGASTVVPDAVLSVAARISGRAINAQGVGIPGVLVTLYETHYYFMESTPTDSSGNFTLEGLPAVQCKIEFQAWDTVVYLSEWYNDKGSFDDADLVTLNTGGNLVLDDTVLREGGTVTGRVLDEGGRGMGGIYITAYDENYYYLGDADCDADGHYSLQGLPAGNCKIFYDVNEGNYLSQWYRDKKIFDDADPVMINPGITTSLPDVVLREGGMIRGKVTAGMSNCDVTVFDENYMYVTFAMPGNDGSYQLEGIPTGRYYVHFASYDANYISQWYNGKASFDEADAVDVRKGSTTNLRKTRLEPGGVIKGRVLDAGGNGIANIYVEVFDENGFYLSGDETAPDGNFFVPGLTTGVCKIAFNCYGTGNYVDEWYDDKDGMDSADVFRATAGREYELPDVVLADGAKIRGTITNGGMGLEGIYAIAFRLSDGASWYAFSDSSGDYAIYNLPAAEYKVRFQSHSNYISEWYNDRPDEASADILGLAEGRELPGIDAEMQLGGSIKGTVTDSTGNPLAMVDVVVKTDDEEAYWAITDGLGNYTVDVLPTGTYKTLFDPGYLNYYYDPTDSNNYVYQWYDNAETFNTAANIQVNVSQTVSGLDARLQEGGSITGNITNFNGDPVSNANIRVYRTGMEDVGYTLNVFSDGMGSYRVKGLVAGDYFVVFDALNLGYDLEYYDNAATEAEATPVSVPATGQVTGIDAVLNQ